VGWLWLWSASLREHQAPASEDELAEFETDVLAGFVLARASAGLTDSTIRNDTNHLALLAPTYELSARIAAALDPSIKVMLGGPLAPDINALPFVDRRFLAQDPHLEAGRWEANMVGARGCPYNCSFCGAAVSANPDITIRVRTPDSILAEMDHLRQERVTAFRFVDDLFLGHRRVIDTMMDAFTAAGTGGWAKWDATGRINILNRLDDAALDRMAAAGLREVALGIESGSQRMLTLIDKRITPDMARDVVGRLACHGISVKGYFILGFPGETAEEVDMTVALIRDLWNLTDPMPGGFTASAFEYRPYPGTPDWDRLIAAGKYTPGQLLNYTAVDLTSDGTDTALFERDEFNFSVNLPLADAPISHVRSSLVTIAREQWARFPRTAA
jgi:anaerobic magnesium-protoporphyrin IX monomethyl ester cyclase